MLLSKVQKALCNYEQCRSGAAVIAVLLSITELKSKSFWPVGFITIFGHLRAPFVAYVGDPKPKLTFLVKCLNLNQPEVFVVSATTYNQELKLKNAPHIFNQFWPAIDSRVVPNFCMECRDGQWTTSVWGYHCKQASCHTCILQKMGQISVCPWHPETNEPSNELTLRVCHFCCHKDPATSVVTVTGYTKLHSNSFTISIFHIRKTFRRRVLQKIVGVSHTTHIPHISSTFYISHTYPFQTYPPHISHTYPAHCTYPTHIHSKRIPHIRIPSVRIHAMRIHSKGCNTYPTNHHQYPIHIQHIIHIPHISIPNVSIPNVSHQYVSIANVSIQKVCISRNRKRIPPIHIPPIRIFNTYPTSTDPFNAYPFKKFASAGMALSMSITAYHFISFIPLLLGGNGNEYKNLAFPSILCKIIN